MKIDFGERRLIICKLGEAAYLILAQDEIKAWAYHRRAGEQFPPGPQVFVGADTSISVPALSIDLPLIDIYGGIDFD